MKRESVKKGRGREQNEYERRFHLMMRLFRIHQMLKKAKITYPSK
jgi:hypothetical protein